MRNNCKKKLGELIRVLDRTDEPTQTESERARDEFAVQFSNTDRMRDGIKLGWDRAMKFLKEGK